MIQSCGVGILARPIGRQGCLPPQEKQGTFLVGILLCLMLTNYELILYEVSAGKFYSNSKVRVLSFNKANT